MSEPRVQARRCRAAGRGSRPPPPPLAAGGVPTAPRSQCRTRCQSTRACSGRIPHTRWQRKCRRSPRRTGPPTCCCPWLSPKARTGCTCRAEVGEEGMGVGALPVSHAHIGKNGPSMHVDTPGRGSIAETHSPLPWTSPQSQHDENKEELDNAEPPESPCQGDGPPLAQVWVGVEQQGDQARARGTDEEPRRKVPAAARECRPAGVQPCCNADGKGVQR